MSVKKFFGVIGNPPYQDQAVGEQKTYQKPIYNDFLDEAYKCADVVEMVHPARFLFNAGSTPKAWNRKMLQDKHLKVVDYRIDSREIFPNQEIKGGIAITLRDTHKEIGPIGFFAPYLEMNDVVKKVTTSEGFKSFSEIVVTRTAYRFTDKMHEDYPDAADQLSDGHAYDVSTNIFERLPQVFYDKEPADDNEYIRILGRENNERKLKYIRRDYIAPVWNLDAFKLFLSKANGNGQFGEALTPPIVGEPAVGNTETFISIGCFDSVEEAENAVKYLRSKFVRALLGVVKTTQDVRPETWTYVPLQDFSSHSDIDWSQTITAIDSQLYKKYGLTDDEVDFIETHVKEMQ